MVVLRRGRTPGRMMAQVVGAATVAALAVVVCGRWAIALLQRAHFWQRIREDVPAQHRAKTGTPTMGGVLILVAVLLATLLVSPGVSAGVAIALIVMVGYGAVGAVDDLLAVRRQRNLGLRARERLAVQVPLAFLVAVYVLRRPELGSVLLLPWVGHVDLGWVYLPFAIVYLVGFANAVNLADGLDGLAGGSVAIAAGAYAVIALRAGQPAMASFAAAVAGACLGFLWFNAHPAAVFMGDVGSNALGAALAALAIITKTEVVLLVVGFVFVLEAASVLLQVAYFKATGGRRLLRMSPLHHHFELAGWSETQTVTRLWVLAAFCALFGLTLRL